MWLHSMIDHAQEDGTIVFQDGSSIKADVIMHCTGYLYDFPFLGDDNTISVWMTTVLIHYTSMFSHQKWHLNCPSSDCLGRLFPFHSLNSKVSGLLEFYQDRSTFHLKTK